MNNRRWMPALAALTFLYLPLRAAESPPPPDAQTAEPVADIPPVAATPVDDAEPEEVEPAEEPAPPRAAPSGDRAEAGERLSLDNNLSFPVDI